jgi:hypothetical protein
MISLIRSRFKLVCLVCFALTTGAGVFALIAPGVIDVLAGSSIDITDQSRFFYQSFFLLVTLVGFWFLIIMLDPDANKPLLILAIAEKLVFVGFFFYAMGPLKLSYAFLPVVLGDLLMGIVCLIYLVLGPEQKEAAY